MLMTSLVRDADALGSIKVEVVLHYQSLGMTLQCGNIPPRDYCIRIHEIK